VPTLTATAGSASRSCCLLDVMSAGELALGAALPAQAIAIVDPDRFPSAGGLAVLREPEGLRLVIVTFDRQGRMIGYSLHPEREILLDERDPAEVAMVIAALFDGAGHDQ